MSEDDIYVGVPRHTTVSAAMVRKLRQAKPGTAGQLQQLETIDLWIGQLFELRARILARRRI